MVSITMDGRSKKALQTMEQDLSVAAKEVAGLPEDLAGLFDNNSLLGDVDGLCRTTQARKEET